MDKVKLKLLVDFLGQKSGTVIEVDEADVKTLVDAKKAEEYVETKDGDGNPDAGQKALDDLVAKLDNAVKGVFESHAQRYIKALQRQTAAAVAGKGGRLNIGAALARNDAGDDDAYGYKGLGDFANDVRESEPKSGKAFPDRLKGYFDQYRAKAPTGMSEQLFEDGAALVPVQVAQGIYERTFDASMLPGMADNMPMTGNVMQLNGLADDSRATGSRWGGVRGYRVEEGAQLTGSKPKFTKIELRLHKYGVLVYVTDEQLADSTVALDQWLSKKAGDELNFMLSDDIVNGSGTNAPRGIVGAPGTQSVTRATTNHIKYADVEGMWNRLFARSRAQAAWFINQEVEPDLNKMFMPIQNVAGTENVGGLPVYLPGGFSFGSQAASGLATLKGRPVYPIEWCAALGTEGDIILADMSQYLIGTRGGVQSAMSIHLRFDYDETAFRFITRFDGKPWWNKAVTPYKGSSGVKYSPYVTLAA